MLPRVSSVGMQLYIRSKKVINKLLKHLLTSKLCITHIFKTHGHQFRVGCFCNMEELRIQRKAKEG